VIFGVLFGCPRGVSEEGGQFVFALCNLGEFIGVLQGMIGELRVSLRTIGGLRVKRPIKVALRLNPLGTCSQGETRVAAGEEQAVVGVMGCVQGARVWVVMG
jgi:hypothetical protein